MTPSLTGETRPGKQALPQVVHPFKQPFTGDLPLPAETSSNNLPLNGDLFCWMQCQQEHASFWVRNNKIQPLNLRSASGFPGQHVLHLNLSLESPPTSTGRTERAALLKVEAPTKARQSGLAQNSGRPEDNCCLPPPTRDPLVCCEWWLSLWHCEWNERMQRPITTSTASDSQQQAVEKGLNGG